MLAHKPISCGSTILHARASLDVPPVDAQTFDWARYTNQNIIERSVNSSHGDMWEVGPSRQVSEFLKSYLGYKIT